jgi:hypothetical protein
MSPRTVKNRNVTKNRQKSECHQERSKIGMSPRTVKNRNVGQKWNVAKNGQKSECRQERSKIGMSSEAGAIGFMVISPLFQPCLALPSGLAFFRGQRTFRCLKIFYTLCMFLHLCRDSSELRFRMVSVQKVVIAIVFIKQVEFSTY